jgi:hypothetical protein
VEADRAFDGAVLAREIEVAEVREAPDAEPGDVLEGGLEVEGLGEGAAGFREQFEIALGAAAGGDIAKDEDDPGEPALGVMDGRAAVVDGDFRAVAAEEQGVIGETDGDAETAHFVDGTFDDDAGFFMDNAEDVFERAVEGFGLRPASERFGDRIHEDNIAAGVAGDDGVADAAQDSGEPEISLR